MSAPTVTFLKKKERYENIPFPQLGDRRDTLDAELRFCVQYLTALLPICSAVMQANKHKYALQSS
jgi:hypothetical protein